VQTLHSIAGATEGGTSTDDATEGNAVDAASAVTLAKARAAAMGLENAVFNPGGAAGGGGGGGAGAGSDGRGAQPTTRPTGVVGAAPAWARVQAAALDLLLERYADVSMNPAATIDPDLSPSTPRAELLRYTRSAAITSSLLKFDNRDGADIAPLLYADIVQHVRGELSVATSLPFLQALVASCLDKAALRDEVLCQLIRQTNGNPVLEQQLQAWHALCLCCMSFPPSETLQHALRQYAADRGDSVVVSLLDLAEDEPVNLPPGAARTPAERVKQRAQLNLLKKYAECTLRGLAIITLHGPRRVAPGAEVIDALHGARFSTVIYTRGCAISSHACSLETRRCVTNGIPLEWPLSYRLTLQCASKH
jgi:hypothetical protein